MATQHFLVLRVTAVEQIEGDSDANKINPSDRCLDFAADGLDDGLDDFFPIHTRKDLGEMPA